MQTVFNNNLFQKQFDKNGYVIIPSLLMPEDIDGLKKVFDKFLSEYTSSFHTTHFSTNIDYKKEAHETISNIVFKRVKPFLNDFKPLFGNFMVKTPDPNTSLDIHTDWTYVDESKFSSAAVWIPLVNTSKVNGALGIVEGSHKITNKIRGPLIRESSRDFNAIWANRYGRLLNMNAGDAIIYHHGLLHFSPPNKSDVIRPALNLTVVPDRAEYVHYCMPEGTNEIEMYKVNNPDFYLHYNHFQRPQINTLIKKFPADTVEYIDPKMKNYRVKRFWTNLKTLITNQTS